jgi:predicted nucleic acid-binding protein
VIGWLLDTNVVSALINPNGAPSVKAWAAQQDENNLFLSVLSLAEYDKGIFNLAEDHPDRQRYIASRDALEARFAGRILSVDDATVRRWGRIAGTVKRETGHPPQVIDTLLTATAIEHDLYLTTRNVRDTTHAGATVFDPWNDDPSKFPLSPRRNPRG